ncbi:MAG: M23 family metallopeptidase [Desulfobacteraceae bacterium]|nr:M23 family metallopeptidase [Desulfobacteraceae bacterium]
MRIIESYLKKIAEINDLDIADAENRAGEWIFHHGMLFLSPHTWWQSRETPKSDKRKTPHEGIDILFFKDRNKQIQNLGTNTLIPAATDGEVINICHDFIGKSIVVRHNISFMQQLDLIFVYAHILPDSMIKVGTALKQGDIIATIAKTEKEKTTLPPHLHFSVIEIPENTPAKNLNWELFSHTASKLNLINPLII